MVLGGRYFLSSFLLALWPVLYTPCARCRAFELTLFNICFLLLIKKKKKCLLNHGVSASQCVITANGSISL